MFPLLSAIFAALSALQVQADDGAPTGATLLHDIAIDLDDPQLAGERELLDRPPILPSIDGMLGDMLDSDMQLSGTAGSGCSTEPADLGACSSTFAAVADGFTAIYPLTCTAAICAFQSTCAWKALGAARQQYDVLFGGTVCRSPTTAPTNSPTASPTASPTEFPSAAGYKNNCSVLKRNVETAEQRERQVKQAQQKNDLNRSALLTELSVHNEYCAVAALVNLSKTTGDSTLNEHSELQPVVAQTTESASMAESGQELAFIQSAMHRGARVDQGGLFGMDSTMSLKTVPAAAAKWKSLYNLVRSSLREINLQTYAEAKNNTQCVDKSADLSHCSSAFAAVSDGSSATYTDQCNQAICNFQSTCAWESMSAASRQQYRRLFGNVTCDTPVPSQFPTTFPTVVPSTTAPTHSVAPDTPPTNIPTFVPTTPLTSVPTTVPTTLSPTYKCPPTKSPTMTPTLLPSIAPTAFPTAIPTYAPTTTPTGLPTVVPTVLPTSEPSLTPSVIPTSDPSHVPTHLPTVTPTTAPSEVPSPLPSVTPSEVPTTLPPTTDKPSLRPTATPTQLPTAAPSQTPTEEPTDDPTTTPTDVPTALPTTDPTNNPTSVPSHEPSSTPSHVPTVEPSSQPTLTPTAHPSVKPTITPTIEPSTTVPTTTTHVSHTPQVITVSFSPETPMPLQKTLPPSLNECEWAQRMCAKKIREINAQLQVLNAEHETLVAEQKLVTQWVTNATQAYVLMREECEQDAIHIQADI